MKNITPMNKLSYYINNIEKIISTCFLMSRLNFHSQSKVKQNHPYILTVVADENGSNHYLSGYFNYGGDFTNYHCDHVIHFSTRKPNPSESELFNDNHYISDVFIHFYNIRSENPLVMISALTKKEGSNLNILGTYEHSELMPVDQAKKMLSHILNKLYILNSNSDLTSKSIGLLFKSVILNDDLEPVSIKHLKDKTLKDAMAIKNEIKQRQYNIKSLNEASQKEKERVQKISENHSINLTIHGLNTQINNLKEQIRVLEEEKAQLLRGKSNQLRDEENTTLLRVNKEEIWKEERIIRTLESKIKVNLSSVGFPDNEINDFLMEE